MVCVDWKLIKLSHLLVGFNFSNFMNYSSDHHGFIAS